MATLIGCPVGGLIFRIWMARIASLWHQHKILTNGLDKDVSKDESNMSEEFCVIEEGLWVIEDYAD